MKSLTFDLLITNPVFTLSQVMARYFVGQVVSVITKIILRRLFKIIMEKLNNKHGVFKSLINDLIQTTMQQCIKYRDKKVLRKAAAILSGSDIHELYFSKLISKEDAETILAAKTSNVVVSIEPDSNSNIGGNL